MGSPRPRNGAHLPAEPVTIGTQRRQVCAWCGTILEDLSLLHTYMSDDGPPPDYSSEHWYGFDGPATFMISPADEPPANACCREVAHDA